MNLSLVKKCSFGTSEGYGNTGSRNVTVCCQVSRKPRQRSAMIHQVTPVIRIPASDTVAFTGCVMGAPSESALAGCTTTFPIVPATPIQFQTSQITITSFPVYCLGSSPLPSGRDPASSIPSYPAQTFPSLFPFAATPVAPAQSRGRG